MKAGRSDRGAVAMSVVAPIIAAVIGGLGAIGAAIQVVNMASSDTESSQTQQVGGEVDYGDR